MNDLEAISGYRYHDASHNSSHSYILPAVEKLLDEIKENRTLEKNRLFDLGCGNGSVAAHLAERGWEVVGVDASADGIRNAKSRYPYLTLESGSAYEDLEHRFGRFPVVLSLEVVEHLYDPRAWAKNIFSLLEPGGDLVVSTPYHGYLKNLVLSVTGKMDAHFTALWDHGHIKFWSINTLTKLLTEAGFVDIRFARVGRVPSLAKSMIASARKPA